MASEPKIRFGMRMLKVAVTSCALICLIMGMLSAVFTLPHLYERGGWIVIAASAVWPFAALGAFLAVGSATHIVRWRVIWSISFFVAMELAIFAVPPIWIAYRYDIVAALASSTIGIAALTLGGCVEGLVQRRRSRPYRDFEARFSAGPVGRWRTQTFEELPGAQPGCEVMFATNGQGRFRQWKAFDSQEESLWTQFRWRLIEPGTIEIETEDQPESGQTLTCHFSPRKIDPQSGLHLILWKKELFEQLIRLGDPADQSYERYAACQWPGDFIFMNIGSAEQL